MNFNYHIHKSNIECPYCDKICHDDDYSVASELEVRVEFECEHCGKKFFAEACIVYNTYSDCVLNNKKHDLIQSESHPTLFDCNDCYYYEVKPTVKETLVKEE